MDIPTTFYSLTLTMSDDAPHPLTIQDIPFYECNLHCYTNDLYYGNGSVMAAKILANDVASFRNGNLRDIFIQNATAGNNGVISVVATVPTKWLRKQLDFAGV